MGRIIDAAAVYHVVIELNASPYRFDIDWRYQREARQKGVLISIDPDAHAAKGLAELLYGVGIARKGWLEAHDVLNTRDIAEVREYLGRVRDEKRR
jgi:DNA polymerase (family 10)